MGREDLKVLITRYGPLAIGTHIILSLSAYGLTYILLDRGFDIESRFRSWGLLKEADSQGKSTIGKAGIAYILYKCTMPVRIPITIAAVTFIAKFMKK